MTKQFIEVIQAHLDGKTIEAQSKTDEQKRWYVTRFPFWNFFSFEYRIAPEPKIPDTIDWSHVAPEFKFMAQDEDGGVYLYTTPPSVHSEDWFPDILDTANAESFASYKRGNMEWQDSLVARPQP